MAALVEVASGLYRGTLVVPATAAKGLYDVRSTLTHPQGQVQFLGPRFAVEAAPAPGPAPPPPVPAPPPPEPGTIRLPEWTERVVDAFSWLVTAWVVAQVIMWFGLDNFIIAAAVGVALVLLVPGFLRPAQLFFRAIVLELVATLVEILDFLREWLRGVAEYFQGNFVRALIRILSLAAFMWIWNLALGVPAIKQLFDTIIDVAGRVTKWINDQVDWLLGQVEQLRLQARGWVDDLLGKVGVIGGQIRNDILALVDQFFAGLRRELQELRFELLSRVDIVRQLLRAEVEILGVKMRLIPDEVRTYLLARFFAAQAEHIAQVDAGYGSTAAPPPPPPVGAAAPWIVADLAIAEIVADDAGLLAVTGAQEDELEKALREGLTKIPALVRGPYQKAVDDLLRNWRAMPVSAGSYAAAAIADLRAVLAGKPPLIPDWPPEFKSPPAPPPP